jgi:hypothetical protein
MATILDLFNSQKKELYNNEIIRIDSRGLINPPRVAALAASSPNVIADLIGGQVAGIIGGSASRPSDTIFKKGNPQAKPITITAATQALLRDVVEKDTDYVIKQTPSPNSVISNINQGGSSVRGVATNLAIQSLNKYGSKSGFNQLKNDLKTKKEGDDRNGSFSSPRYTNQKPFSEYKEKFGDLEEFNRKIKGWDNTNTYAILNKESYENYAKFDEEIKKYPNSNQVPVLFKKYGNSTVIPFVGSISGISEDVSPEWNGFKYIGSPFKIYRYSGVERSLKFNLKLYYTIPSEKQIMIKKINYLKSLAFPYEKTSTITYSGTGDKNAQIAFSPNLLYVSIGDMYKDVFGYMESLSFSIDENVTWAADEDSTEKQSLYPSVIDVSISIKIIENKHQVKKGTETSTYNYNFDGRKTEVAIVEKPEPNLAALMPAGSGVRAPQTMAPGSGVLAPKPPTYNPLSGLTGFK